MSDIHQKKSCCWFYHSGGSAYAGGCTKAYLDAVNGDVSAVHNNGAALFSGTVGTQNSWDVNGKTITAMHPSLALVAAAGLILMRDSACYEEVISTDGSATTVFQGSGQWVNEHAFYYSHLEGGHSVLNTSLAALVSQNQPIVVQTDAGEYAVYAVLQTNGLDEIQVSDNGYLANQHQDGICALQYPGTVGVILGGANNDLQSTLNQANAYYHNQWIFFNEEIAPSVTSGGAAYHLYSSHDGEIANNTKLYIVGYNTHAYDCLPAGYGYFPEGTQNTGTYYKSPLERAKNSSDAAIKADLPTATTKNLSNDWERIFRLYANTENIQFMGIYFEVAVYHWPIIADNESTGSLFVKHCAGGHVNYDAAPDFYGGQIVRLEEAATGGGIYDSFFKGVEIFSGTTPSIDHSGDWEFAYNVGIYTGNINPEYSGPVVHHNIFVKSYWGASVVARSFQNVFNNIFYLCRRAGFNLNGAEGRLRAWNNIIVMNESDENYWGLFNISTGGTVDYFNYNCYCNQNGQPVSVFAHDSEINLTFNFDSLTKGAHDIEKDPLFIDPANWDFRLRPNSPCIGTGRPDPMGNPANIGFYPETPSPGLYGKHSTLYGC